MYNDYVLEFGNYTRSAYLNLKIHANRNGINLENMSYQDVVTKLYEALAIFNSDIYQFPLDFSFDELYIKHIELNVTFPASKPFNNYKRIFDLMCHSIRENTPNSSKVDASKWYNLDKQELTSHYLYKGNPLEVICYDKTAEIQKKNPAIEIDTCYMRIEISNSGNALSSMAFEGAPRINYCIRLADTNDEYIKNYFFSFFEPKFNWIDKHLHDGLDKTLKGFLTITPAAPGFILSSLQYALDTQPYLCIKQYLKDVTLAETKRDVPLPLLLDIKDLKNLFSTPPSSNEMLENIFFILSKTLKEGENLPHVDDTMSFFTGQRALYEEIQKAIFTPKEYPLFDGIANPSGKHQIVCLTNPSAKQTVIDSLFGYPCPLNIRQANVPTPFQHYLRRYIHDDNEIIEATINNICITNYLNSLAEQEQQAATTAIEETLPLCPEPIDEFDVLYRQPTRHGSIDNI